MLYILFFLSLFSHLLADNQDASVTENDPASFVEGVSVITGDFCMQDEYYTVPGAEPICFKQVYVSRDNVFNGYEHLIATFKLCDNVLEVKEPHGTNITYRSNPGNGSRGPIGKEFYGTSAKKVDSFQYVVRDLGDSSKGVSNTASGRISGQTRLQNQYIVFDSKKHPKGKSFDLYTADGTVRTYVNLESQKKNLKIPHSRVFGSTKCFAVYRYKLVFEKLPNGHIVEYHWDSYNRLFSIQTMNRSKTKVFAKVDCFGLSPQAPIPHLFFSGSDGQTFSRDSTLLSLGQAWVPVSMSSPNRPDIFFDWIAKDKKVLEKIKKHPHLSCASLANQKALDVQYETKWGPETFWRVKTISSPVGKDETPLVTHTFVYGNQTSHVIDIQGNKTEYHWNRENRLTRIQRFIGLDQLHSEEQFVWDKSLLKCKSFFNQDRQCIYAKTFAYDGYGNITKETFHGNLSGAGGFVQMAPNRLPIAKGVESSTTISRYTQNGKNVPKRVEGPNGLVTKYTYVPDTNLVKTKELFNDEQSKIRHVYDYDEDLLLISEMIDDGIAKTFKKITPKKEQPFVGMPEIFEEKYWNGFQEVLLKKTVVHYRTGGLIDWKDIYDADGTFQYRLHYEYGDKNRLISETNPIGQKVISKYDDLGNRYYQKSFSGRTETKSEYDFSNRLIKNEWVADGTSRCNIYSYDTKHHLEFEEDERGNQTKYKYNLLGQRIETELPPIPLDTGELVTPTIQQDYDSMGNEILRIDAEGHETRTSYNAYNKPVLITHPDGSKESYTYSSHDLTGQIKTYTDPLGIVTSYVYDYLGRVLEKTISSHGKILSEETCEYTGYHLMAKTDAEGNRTVYTYDLAGRKASETFAGETTKYFYDSLGRQHKTQKGDVFSISEYDLMDRVIEERRESVSGEILRKTQYQFDEAGNRKTVIQFVLGKEEKETSKYDGMNRLIEKTNAKGFTETISYADVLNDYGQKVLQKTHTDAMGLQTIETFDTHNRPAKIEKRKEKTLSITEKFYTKNGLLSSQVDTIFSPDGTVRQSRVRWQYDQRGRLITLIEAAGTADEKITQRAYTLRGELKRIIKPDKVEVFYEYNDLGQLISIISSDQTVHHQMSYNRLGHLQTSDDLIRVTDALGRVVTETFPLKYSVFNRFDSIGRKASCHIPDANCFIEYKYNALDLMEVIRKTNDEQELYAHQYKARDLAGNLSSEQLINGNWISHAFDERSCRTGIETDLFFQKVLEFDPVGNISKMQIQRDEIDYDYDDLYQLISESGPFAHEYVYDSLHNRLKNDEESYEINALHQVISHLEYDKNGNPIKQNETTYKYDALDRLIEVQTPTMIQTFVYDSFHRCLSKTVTENNAVKILHFIYDGQNEIGSFDEHLVLQELRVLGNIAHAEIGASIAIELSGSVFAPIHDLQGNIAVLLPLNDSSPSFYRYSAFGEEKIDGPTLSPWRFSSKRSDASTGLVYFGRRFYMPFLGRWLTPDPAGFTDGMNLYAFLSNDPLTRMDLYGLTGFDVDGWKQFSWEGSAEKRFWASQNPKGYQYTQTWNSSLQNSFRTNSSAIFPSLNPFSKGAPHFVVNGMQNTAANHFQSAYTIHKTFGYESNVIPAYSETFGPIGDGGSVLKSKYTANYTSFFIRQLSRELQFTALCMDLLQDPRKISVSAFSRGVADTYFSTKDLAQNIKNRLIITGCGGTLIIPRSCGFIVKNLISEGDWPSRLLNGISYDPEEREEMLKMHKRDADVYMLKQIDSSGGINGDHFFQSQTYQEGLQRLVVPEYKKHGFLK